MQFINEVRKNPTCYFGQPPQLSNSGHFLTKPPTFSLEDLISDVEVFDVNEVARHLIESQRISREGIIATRFTAKGQELLKPKPSANKSGPQELDLSQYVGVFPPYPLCWFEYDTVQFRSVDSLQWTGCTIDQAILIRECDLDTVPVSVRRRYAADNIDLRCAMNAYVMHHYEHRKVGSFTTVESDASILCDADGTVLQCGIRALDTSHMRQTTPVIMAMVAMMFMNWKFLKVEKSKPPEPKTENQRKHWAVHGQPPFATHHIVTINPETTCALPGTSKEAQYKMAWHKVISHPRRSHERHLISGKVVTVKASRVKAHERGNKDVGMIRKTYAIDTIK